MDPIKVWRALLTEPFWAVACFFVLQAILVGLLVSLLQARKSLRLWIILDNHPYWAAGFFATVHLLFLGTLLWVIQLNDPSLAEAGLRDPRVLSACLALVSGSVTTVVTIILINPTWDNEHARQFGKQSGLRLLPLLSGVCMVGLVPTSAMFYIVHGPLFALVVMRGTGFVSARLVDELLFRRGLTERRVSRREDLVALIAACCIWLGIVIPATNDPGHTGRLFTQAWLFPVYFAAYTLRLWFLSLFNARWQQDPQAPSDRHLRLPYFVAYEQFPLIVATFVSGLCAYFWLSADRTRLSIASAGLPFYLVGALLGASAVLGIAVLLGKGRTTTHNFALYRVSSSLAGVGAYVLVFAALLASSSHRAFPTRDVLLAGGLVLALLVLHAGRYEDTEDAAAKEPAWAPHLQRVGRSFWQAVHFALGKPALPEQEPPQVASRHLPPLDPRWQAACPRDEARDEGVSAKLRFFRFLFLIGVLAFLTPGTNSVLRILAHSPYRDTINPVTVAGEILYSSIASVLPVMALFAFLYFVFQTRGASRDAAVLVDHGEFGIPTHGIVDQAQWWRVDTAAKRLTLAVGVMTALIGLGAWMQSGAASRNSVSVALSQTFGTPQVRAGRRLLRTRTPATTSHDAYRCEVCSSLRAYLRGDTAVVVDSLTRQPLRDPPDRDIAHVVSDWSIATRARDSGPPEIPQALGDAARPIYVRVDDLTATLNAVEAVLEARRIGALSEVEFHSVWAGVTREVLDRLQVHLDGYRIMQDRLGEYQPMLSQQMATQPWPSDGYDSSRSPRERLKRKVNHERIVEQAEAKLAIPGKPTVAPRHMQAAPPSRPARALTKPRPPAAGPGLSPAASPA